MSYKKKVSHIKENKAKPYNAQFNRKNQAKKQHDAIPPHPGRGTYKRPPKQAPSFNVVPRQNWRSPLQAWIETTAPPSWHCPPHAART